MSTKHPTVAVPASPAAAVRLDLDDKDFDNGVSWTCYNTGTTRVWIGGEGVAINQGIPVEPGGFADQQLRSGSHLYGVAEGGAGQLNTLQVGV